MYIIMPAMTEESSSFIICGRQTSINSERSWFLEFNSREAYEG